MSSSDSSQSRDSWGIELTARDLMYLREAKPDTVRKEDSEAWVAKRCKNITFNNSSINLEFIYRSCFLY